MSVSILYYKVTPEKMRSAQLYELINTWRDELPAIKQQQVSKLHQQADQVLSLAGLQLLKVGMAEFSDIPFSLKQLQFPDKRKPYLNSGIDFNISHSGDIAICVISNSMKVGVDIELQRDITPGTMHKFLSERTSHSENTPEEDRQQFFNLWTKNEAIIKAANYGSIFTMKEISPELHGGYYQNHFWYTYPIRINSPDDHSYDNKKEYTCHIACSEKITDSNLEQLKPKQIYNL